MLAGFLLSAF